MLHSGSRNIGNITAQNYDKIAQAQLTQQNIKVPGGLNYLEIDSKPGQEYLQVTLLDGFILFLFHVSIFFGVLFTSLSPPLHFICQSDSHHAATCDTRLMILALIVQNHHRPYYARCTQHPA